MFYELNFWIFQGIKLHFSIALPVEHPEHSLWRSTSPTKPEPQVQYVHPICANTDLPHGFQDGSTKWALLGMAFQSSLLACKKENFFSSQIWRSAFASSCPSLNWRSGYWHPFCDPERKLALASEMIKDRKDFVASTPEAAVTFTMTDVDDQYVFNPSDPHVFLLGSSEQYIKLIPPPKHWNLCET